MPEPITVHDPRWRIVLVLLMDLLIIIALAGSVSAPRAAFAGPDDGDGVVSDGDRSEGAFVRLNSIALNRLEAGMLDAINAERQQAGLPATIGDDQLTEVARLRSEDMASKNYFSHTAPDGSTAISLLAAKDVHASDAAEILGRTNGPDEGSVELVVVAFMNSPAHRAVLLRGRYARIGVGSATGAGNMKYFAVIFAED